MTIKVLFVLCYLKMSNPMTGELPPLNARAIGTSIINSPVGSVTAHVTKLALNKVIQLSTGSSTTTVNHYQVGETDVFNIWE